ncbi:MAG: pyrroloquinoline quinone precursor peptide PqqA [Pseudomonadota bacterium]
MAWTKPEIIEVSCGMEIARYMPADEEVPPLF